MLKPQNDIVEEPPNLQVEVLLDLFYTRVIQRPRSDLEVRRKEPREEDLRLGMSHRAKGHVKRVLLIRLLLLD